MTSVTFHTEQGRITGFDAKGHSGYADTGEDILCASISAAVTLTEATINDVLGLAAAVRTCQSLLTGLMLYFTMLHDEYPENIEVLEAD